MNPAKLTREQRKELDGRISRAVGWEARSRLATAAEPAETPAIRAARALIARHEAACRKARGRVEQRIAEENRKAREKLLFATADQALAAVHALERKYGGRP